MKEYVPVKGPDVMEHEAYLRALWLARDYLTGSLERRVREILDRPARVAGKRAEILYGSGDGFLASGSRGSPSSGPTERKGIALAMVECPAFTPSEKAALADYSAVCAAFRTVEKEFLPGLKANVAGGTPFPFNRERHMAEKRKFLKELASRRGYL